MSGNYYTRTVTVEWGHDHTLEVEVGAYPYSPAVTSGPPERCCPAEGGMEEIREVRLVKVFIKDGTRKEKGRRLSTDSVIALEENNEFFRSVEEAFEKAEAD